VGVAENKKQVLAQLRAGQVDADTEDVLSEGASLAEALLADPLAAGEMREAIAGLTVGDVDTLARLGDREYRQQLLLIVDSNLDEKFLRGKIGRVVRSGLVKLSKDGPLEIAEVLTLPVINPIAEEELGERFDEPSEDDVRELARTLEKDFSKGVIRLYLLAVAAGGADGALAAGAVAREYSA